MRIYVAARLGAARESGRGAEFVEGGEEGGDVGGEGGGELHSGAGGGVGDGDAVGVQCLALDEGRLVLGRLEAEEVGAVEGGAAAVEAVGDDGVADVGEVDADLVGAAGEEFDVEECEAAVAALDAVDGAGGLAALAGDGDGLGVAAAAGEGEVNEVAVKLRFSLDYGEVVLFDGAGLELGGEGGMGGVGLGAEDDAAGVAVEAVDDAGPQLAVGRGEGLCVGGEGVDEGAALVALGGVDDEVGGLVDDEDVLVLEQDVEGDVLGGDGGAFWEVGRDLDAVAAADAVARLGGRGVDSDAPFADEALDEGAGEVGEGRGEVLVEASLAHAATDGEALAEGVRAA